MLQQPPDTVALFTDFGHGNLYTGQVQLVLAAAGINQPVVELVSDAPAYHPMAAAYLLAALANSIESNVLFLCVVDPGVGSDRSPLFIRTDRHWYVGPDNGIFSRTVSQSSRVNAQTITWQPSGMSESFHGRDLFAPVSARLCRGEVVAGNSFNPDHLIGYDWPQSLFEIIYIDHYGNAFTGIQAAMLSKDACINVAGHSLRYARVFSEVPVGALFWYVNSIGLIEIAANQGHAADLVGLSVGAKLSVT